MKCPTKNAIDLKDTSNGVIKIMGNCKCDTVPNNRRFVRLYCEHAPYQFIKYLGYFDRNCKWWFVLSDEKSNGDKMKAGEFASLSIGHISYWEEIDCNGSFLSV